MSGKTGIEWTDATWNPIRGCSRVSEGCRNCYAESVAYRFSGPGLPYEGLVQLAMVAGKDDVRSKRLPLWNGKIKFVEEHLLDPLKWKRPRRIFVNSMSDLFHENVTDEMLDRIFAVMALSPQHTFQVLTKRPERMRAYLSSDETLGRILRCTAADLGGLNGCSATVEDCADGMAGLQLPNVWLGVSVENQKAADERIPLLLQTPAAVRFISAEPLLGTIDLDSIRPYSDHSAMVRSVLTGKWSDGPDSGQISSKLDWVICGGESGTGARPMHPDWARGLRDQCVAAGVPFFFMQAAMHGRRGHSPLAYMTGSGVDMIRVGKKAAGHLLDGAEWHQFPAVRA